MFYVISKIFFILARPSALASLLMLGGAVLLLTRRGQKIGLRAVLAGAVLLIACGLSPLGNILTLPLEDRFPRASAPSSIAGIILLGGYEEAVISGGRPGLAVNDRAERLTETIYLARRYPTAKIIVTGGSAPLLGGAPHDAAGPVGQYLRDIGIAPERIVLEGRSLTTYENALFTRAFVDANPGAPYLLVTSAVHMPRSMGVFRRQGYNVIAWPVDYRTADTGARWDWNDNFPEGLERVDYAFKEWVGLVAYWLTDRTDALFPGPRPK
jgi:uncharacterized SAM-binding protein YcdF (DUF218 family)